MVLEYVPLVVVLLAVFAVAAAPLSRRFDLLLTRAATGIFGEYVSHGERQGGRKRRLLQQTHHGQTYRVYAARTLLFVAIGWLAGSVLGVYGAVAGLSVLRGVAATQLPAGVMTLLAAVGPTTDPLEVALVLVASAATVGVFVALVVYQLRWGLLSYVAGERRRHIDASIQRNVAFVYALSRSGMPFTEVLRVLARNRGVYGETASEFAVTVKDVDMFGFDVISALDRLTERTPSEELEEFVDNLASVLRSGRNLSSFLQEEYEYYREEAEAQQEQFLELLATIAEAYVTVFVAGPLFLITILVVIGLVMGGLLDFLRAIVYLVLPLGTAGFVVYLDSITESTNVGEAAEESDPGSDDRFGDVRTVGAVDVAATDGGVASVGDGRARVDDGLTSDERGTRRGGRDRRARNERRLAIHRRLRPVLRRLSDPLDVVVDRPLTTAYLTVPLAVAYLLARWIPPLTAGRLEIGVYDDPLVHATLLVTGVFAVAYEVRRRRLRAIEMAVPDFLDRLASTNEAGMPVVDSFEQVVRGDLGSLTPELRRTWVDVQLGARIEEALLRFRARLDTPMITRTVTLTTNAMRASGDVGPVLRIAADEAQASRRLQRNRRAEMLTYLVVIYLAFVVFLVIAVALDTIFIPNLPTGTLGQTGGGVTPGIGGLTQITAADKAAYRLLFFHTALVHAVCSGFVAGQMGEGSVKAGAKHASIMLGIAYVAFLAFG